MIKQLKSFDGNIIINSRVEKPGKYDDLFELTCNNQFIPRGAGLSYCLASAGENSVSIETTCFNRILHFDLIKGIIRVEPGLKIGHLLNTVLAKGWYLPVLPGYPGITVGGCIGFNVHGKSQYHDGLFSEYVQSIKLFHPNHGEAEYSRKQNPEIFYLTLGAFGLTGFVTEIELKLKPLKSSYILLKKIHVNSLNEAVDVMHEMGGQFDSIYSWNNLNYNRGKFGKGIVYAEKFLEKSIQPEIFSYKDNRLSPKSRDSFKICFFNSLTIDIECAIYYLKETITKNETILPVKKASFPIYGKEIYFKLFGKKGLREYQLIIPHENWMKFENDFFKLKKSRNVHFTLGSLKIFNGSGKLLNFQMDGICLAFDMVSTKDTEDFFSIVDDLVIKHNGIANISKDSRLKAVTVKNMYPEYSLFKDRITSYEGTKPQYSYLRQQLNI